MFNKDNVGSRQREVTMDSLASGLYLLILMVSSTLCGYKKSKC